MDVGVSHFNALYYDRILLKCLNRAKKKPKDSWYFWPESKGAIEGCKFWEAITLSQTF